MGHAFSGWFISLLAILQLIKFPLKHSQTKLLLLFCRHALDGLEQNLHRINEDLQCKTNSLRLDQQSLAARQKLKDPIQTATERNMTLTGMTRERSKVLA
jgi:hypothetical protein